MPGNLAAGCRASLFSESPRPELTRGVCLATQGTSRRDEEGPRRLLSASPRHGIDFVGDDERIRPGGCPHDRPDSSLPRSEHVAREARSKHRVPMGVEGMLRAPSANRLGGTNTSHDGTVAAFVLRGDRGCTHRRGRTPHAPPRHLAKASRPPRHTEQHGSHPSRSRSVRSQLSYPSSAITLAASCVSISA
jgi:hypothetical protein